jgi:signal transduction histidine kinase
MGQGLDLTARRQDGTEFPVEISLSYVETDEGLRAMAFVTDITERKSLERATRQAERLAALGRLSAGIAHEVNNPIGIMTSRIELILMDAEANGLSPETIEDLRVVHRNAIRVATIAKNLLSFARETPRERTTVDLDDAVRDVLLLVTSDFRRQQVRLVPELKSESRVLAHPNALEQVVLNLLTNAAEAMPDGGEIRIATTRTGDRVQLIVADTGRGIPAEDLAHIFDPFFTTKASGTGLGLSVSYGIVEDHKGTIEVESEPGKGTAFVLTLPAEGGTQRS